MPLGTDPTATFDVILSTDQNKAAPPAFVYRYLSARTTRPLEQAYDGIHNRTPGEEAWRIQMNLATAGLIGFRDLKDERGERIPFPRKADGSPDTGALAELLDTICSVGEVAELIESAREKRHITPELKKKYDFLSGLNMALLKSAIPVPDETSAEPAQASKSHSISSVPSVTEPAAMNAEAGECTRSPNAPPAG